MELIFDIKGMGCAACATRIENALNDLPGIMLASVDLDVVTLRVVCDETHVSEKEIINRVDELGYILSK